MTDWLMRHPFSGDPWGPCSRCAHPAYHEIHRDREQEARDEATIREWFERGAQGEARAPHTSSGRDPSMQAARYRRDPGADGAPVSGVVPRCVAPAGEWTGESRVEPGSLSRQSAKSAENADIRADAEAKP